MHLSVRKLLASPFEDLQTFVLLSSSKDSQLEEPTNSKAWTHALEESEAIVDYVLQTVQIKTFLKWSTSPEETLSQTDHSVAKLHHNSPIVSDHNFPLLW
jgi:hypothetical protein